MVHSLGKAVHRVLLRSFGVGDLTGEQRERVRTSAQLSNSKRFQALVKVNTPTFVVFFLGTVTGLLVSPQSVLWPFYAALFGIATVVNLVFLVLWTGLRFRRGQGPYILLVWACVVGLNWLGMIKTGDHSIYLLALMLTALLFSAPLWWYLVTFLGFWALSVAGVLVLFQGPAALNHIVLLTTMTVPALVTGMLFEVQRIRTELLRLQLELKNEELKEDSFRDALTRLYNRRFLMEWLENQGARVDRLGLEFCLVLIDLDHFKRVNDTAGHPVGDRVLVDVAALLTQSLRESDVVARYGGEEFVLVLTDTPVDQARETVERCLVAFRRHRVAGWKFPVTFSAGLVVRRPGEMAHELIGRADALLYRAKAKGRDRIEDEGLPKPASAPRLSRSG